MLSFFTKLLENNLCAQGKLLFVSKVPSSPKFLYILALKYFSFSIFLLLSFQNSLSLLSSLNFSHLQIYKVDL